MASKASRARGVTATLLGLSIWLVAVWLASRIVSVPLGSLAFWVVSSAAILVLGFVLPISGFHGDSLKVAVAVVLGSWIALGPMGTPFWPFVIGAIVVGGGLVLGASAAGALFMDLDRAEGDATRDD